MEMKKLTNTILSNDYTDFIIGLISHELEKFSVDNKVSIVNYDNWRVNCQKEEYLKDPKFKIYEIKNRNSPNTLVAKVKWIFLCDGKKFDDKYY